MPIAAAAIIAGGAIAGGAISSMGQADANSQSAQSTAQQMAFQERMSGTAYQRAVTDMKAAGLNPMLAYSQGPASTPGGASFQSQNEMAGLGQGVASAGQAAGQAITLQNVKANTDKQQQEALLTQTLQAKADADTRASNASADATEIENDMKRKLYGPMVDEKGEPVQSYAELQRNQQQIIVNAARKYLQFQQEADVAKTNAERQAALQQADYYKQQALKLAKEMPKSGALGKLYSGDLGDQAIKYHEIGTIPGLGLNTAEQIHNLFKGFKLNQLPYRGEGVAP